MTASLSFYTNGNQIPADQGSGLGFYGDSGFAASIAVGAYNGRTFVADGAGTVQGPEGNNIKYLNAGSGIVGQQGSGIGIKNIPNSLATLNARFTNGSAVRTQNAKLYAYDRVSTSNPPSGLQFRCANLLHVSALQTVVGSGDSVWQSPAGSSYMPLCPSPGTSGLTAGNGSNGNVADTQHDFYLAVSVSPSQIGSKQAGIYIELEYY